MKTRTLQALRNLAERPGTEAEGVLARELLDRHEAGRYSKRSEWERPLWKAFDDYSNGLISTDEFVDAMRRRVQWEQDIYRQVEELVQTVRK